MEFNQNKGIWILFLLFFGLLFFVVYKEIQYKRASRYYWDIGILPTKGITSKVCDFSVYSDQDHYYLWGKSYPNIGDDKFDLIYSDDLPLILGRDDGWRVFPNTVEIEWFSLEEFKYWKAKIKLPDGYVDVKQRDRFSLGKPDFYLLAQFQPKGQVVLYIGGPDNPEKRREIGIWQAKESKGLTCSDNNLFEDSSLPLKEQVDLAINKYKWQAFFIDKRQDKIPELEMSVTTYSEVGEFKLNLDKRHLPKMINIYFESEDRNEDYSKTIHPDPQEVVRAFRELYMLDSLSQIQLEITFWGGDSIMLELMDTKAKHRIIIPQEK